MRVESVSARPAAMPPALRSRSVTAPETGPANADPAAALTGAPDAESLTKSPRVESAPAHEPRGRGVLRLLEAGHFKGVADVRLRINFHDELAGRAADRGREALSGAADTLLQSVADGVAALIEAEGIEGQEADAQLPPLTAFEEALREEMQAASEGQSIDPEALAAALRGTFADLVDGLSGLLATESAPESEELSPAALTPAETASEVQAEAGAAPEAGGTDKTSVASDAPDDPFEALSATFERALAQFIDTLSEVMSLPELAPPPGHGAAYAKFLAIYDSLRSPGAVDLTG